MVTAGDGIEDSGREPWQMWKRQEQRAGTGVTTAETEGRDRCDSGGNRRPGQM
ncbi:MAG: hypothetical protein K2K90_08960 [Lachnospiraceae bacterium]|nr:hypothetical protein [Lachnospiraceae bacterium]